MPQTIQNPTLGEYQAFLLDALQRSILFLDVLRRRGNQQRISSENPHSQVLDYASELILDGQTFERPISYALLRILPPAGTVIQAQGRPVLVVDPRAGQSPGIGGFKQQSEVGEALNAGHPVYFIAFSTTPVAKETFPDVVAGQVRLVDAVVARHPDAPRPLVIGNCQAGYQSLMGAVLRPELYGLCLLAGSPMSYWQGQRGADPVNPMRYSGGLLGGSWLAALTSDLNANEFDGAWLVLNFDNLNPANWLWSKQFNVYAQVDTEAERYLQFERWWGDFIVLNGPTMNYLVNELFVGDKLTQNQLTSADGQVFDLRQIKTPIVVFTSRGDNISPPAQTLGWVLDLYPRTEDLQAAGQTVVYCVNPHVGHLGLFVSSQVARKEDEEILSNLDQIAQLAPGLYELVIEPRTAADEAAPPEADPFGVHAWQSRFEPRTLADLEQFGRNTPQEQAAFAAVDALSQRNLTSPWVCVQPALRAWLGPWITPQSARALRELNPLRLSYSLFAEATNPWIKALAPWADEVRQRRQPVAPDNPFWVAQTQASAHIIQSLQQFQKVRDEGVEKTFFQVFGAPWLQTWLGVHPDTSPDPRLHPQATPVTSPAAPATPTVAPTMVTAQPAQAAARHPQTARHSVPSPRPVRKPRR